MVNRFSWVGRTDGLGCGYIFWNAVACYDTSAVNSFDLKALFHRLGDTSAVARVLVKNFTEMENKQHHHHSHFNIYMVGKTLGVRLI